MSREIDAKVCESLGRHEWDESRCRICGWPIVPGGEQGCWKSNCSMRPPPERRADECAHYSTDIAAAIGALQQLTDHGKAGSWKVQCYSVKESSQRYFAKVSIWAKHLGNRDRVGFATGPELGPTICAAILATKGK
jgi:hypothetical protein